MKTAEEVMATVEAERYRFYRQNPQFQPCDANDNLIEEWADKNTLSLELPSTWTKAMVALDEQLAPNRAHVAPVKREPVVPAAPAPVLTHDELLRKLEKESRSDNPEVAFEATDQLHRISAGIVNESPNVAFRKMYPKSIVKRFTPAQLQQAFRKYGSGVVNSVLNEA